MNTLYWAEWRQAGEPNRVTRLVGHITAPPAQLGLGHRLEKRGASEPAVLKQAGTSPAFYPSRVIEHTDGVWAEVGGCTGTEEELPASPWLGQAMPSSVHPQAATGQEPLTCGTTDNQLNQGSRGTLEGAVPCGNSGKAPPLFSNRTRGQ